MHIFVDESGAFVPPEGRPHAVSTIAGLVVSDSAVPGLRDELDRLASRWRMGPEIKGRELNEEHFQTVHQLLESHGAFVVLTAIDVGIHPEQVISQHRRDQAARMTRHLSPDIHPNLRAQVQDLARRIDALPAQLYTQMVLLNTLVLSVVQLGVVHYPQIDPHQLSRFAWRLDAKAAQRTEYEDLWKVLVLFFAQSAALRTPIVFIKGGDYSAFGRFENPDLLTPPPHLVNHVRNVNGAFSTFDVKKVMLDDLDFLDSRLERGLQLADIVANCFQRACNGRLRPEGWVGLSRILIRDPRFGQAIHISHLDTVPTAPRLKDMPYGDVIVALEEAARPCIVNTYRSMDRP